MENREYKKVIEYITDGIISECLKVGDKLPTERCLAETLGISRNSIREAIRTMENMGMIESRQGSGNYLVGNLSKMFIDAIGMMVLLKQISYEEVYNLRKTIELDAYNVAIKKISTDELNELKKIFESMKYSTGHDLVCADKKFHYLLIQASENALIINIMYALEDVYTKSVEHILLNTSNEIKNKLLNIHERILLSLVENDAKNGKFAIEEHYSLVDNDKS